MNLINLRYAILSLGLLFFSSEIASQKWINHLTEYFGNVVIDIEKIDDSQSVVLLNGTDPMLVYMNNDGGIHSTLSVATYFTNVYDMLITDEGIFIVGSSGEFFNSNSVIIKINQDGFVIWTKQFERGFLSSVAKLENDLIVGGNLESPGSKSEQLLMRLDEDGNITWQRSEQLICTVL